MNSATPELSHEELVLLRDALVALPDVKHEKYRLYLRLLGRMTTLAAQTQPIPDEGVVSPTPGATDAL